MSPNEPVPFDAQDWFRRFRDRYNAAAASQLTELGLFYDRHRKFVEYGQRSDPTNPEYTDEEWNRVMAGLFAELATEQGLVQAADWEGHTQLEWYLPGVTDRPLVVIRGSSDATNKILTQDLVELSRRPSDLAVFLMYPDYPCPKGTATVDEASQAWQARIEQRLRDLEPRKQILTLMISAYSFDLPAPWRGFVWSPNSRTLVATD